MYFSDPFSIKRNVARSVSHSHVFEYIYDRFRASYQYFGVTQTKDGPAVTKANLKITAKPPEPVEKKKEAAKEKKDTKPVLKKEKSPDTSNVEAAGKDSAKKGNEETKTETLIEKSVENGSTKPSDTEGFARKLSTSILTDAIGQLSLNEEGKVGKVEPSNDQLTDYASTLVESLVHTVVQQVNDSKEADDWKVSDDLNRYVSKLVDGAMAEAVSKAKGQKHTTAEFAAGLVEEIMAKVLETLHKRDSCTSSKISEEESAAESSSKAEASSGETEQESSETDKVKEAIKDGSGTAVEEEEENQNEGNKEPAASATISSGLNVELTSVKSSNLNVDEIIFTFDEKSLTDGKVAD